MAIPNEFAAFDVANANVTVWAFKKSGGAAGTQPTYTGRWVATDVALDAELRAAVASELARIEEVNPYGLLAQNNEASALSISADETFAPLIVAATADALAQRRATSLKQLQNSDFYALRLVSNGVVLHAVRKTDSSWRAKKRLAVIDALFQDETLTLEETPPFTLSRSIDFFVLGNQILISNKANFESVLKYRQAHADDFQALQLEPDFINLFTNIAALVAHVGTNKIQLRRACAIRAKGHYRDADFMDRLRQHHAHYHLTIQFDGAGLIDPTPETCADIITALLDHRLSSAFSQAIYDVPDATQVA
jgi:isochorismate synthase EntC